MQAPTRKNGLLVCLKNLARAAPGAGHWFESSNAQAAKESMQEKEAKTVQAMVRIYGEAG